MMSSVYKVTEIKGKGLGCIAIVDIEKVSLILDENPQICADIEEEPLSSGLIRSLLKSFYEMSKADQDEYMTLYNKFNNFQDHQNSEDFQNCKENVDKTLEYIKLEIGKIEHDPQKTKEIIFEDLQHLFKQWLVFGATI